MAGELVRYTLWSHGPRVVRQSLLGEHDALRTLILPPDRIGRAGHCFLFLVQTTVNLIGQHAGGQQRRPFRRGP